MIDEENKKEDKIKEIESYLENLILYVPNNFEDYVYDSKTKDACERCFEKIIEAVIDLDFIFIKEKKLSIPEEEGQIFDILLKNNFISIELYKKLNEAKGMRNFIIHQYTKINDELVFHAIAEELISDVRELIKNLNNKK